MSTQQACETTRRFLPPVAAVTQWARESWLDVVTILGTTLLALILYLAKPLASRSFAVVSHDGSVVYPEFAYPLRREIVPAWFAILIGPVLPVILILLFQFKVRSFHDANNAVFGVLYALSNSILFQVFIKWLIGGLRPHFLDVCKPDLSLITPVTSSSSSESETRASPNTQESYNAAGFQSMYYTRDVCTGDPRQINDSLASFPSGHTTAAFAGFVFLYLYLNAKFKVFADRHAPLWQLHLLAAPLLIAVLIGGALTIDEFHNWYDIIAGAVIGTVTAFSAYRMCYAAVFDWRWNHIPLDRTRRFSYGEPVAEDNKDKDKGKK